MAKNKHMTLDDRCKIKQMLDSSGSFKAIGVEIGKDCTTVSKEVRNHRVFKKTGCTGKAFNNCFNRAGCDRRLLCDGCKKTRFCWSCPRCCSVCPDFAEEKCPRLESAPYVCNGCPDLPRCTLEKCFYSPLYADKEYKETLSESRQGISLSEDEVKRLDGIVSPLIMKGQSLNHICATNRDTLMVSESTLYRLVDYNVFSARNIDLPRKVRYSRRKTGKHLKVDRRCRAGRTYGDYLEFIGEHPGLPVTELDSVEGKKGGKVLLTVHFVKAELMLAFIRDYNDSQSVIDIIDAIYLRLGHDTFSCLIPVILTDNGSEFSNPAALESGEGGSPRTRVFYCDPSAPHQKGSAECCHELIRRCIPKGTCMDGYTQEDITLMMNHVNSHCRKSLGNKCPYDVFSFLYGSEILASLGCRKIDPNDVTLSPDVFAGGRTV